MMCCWFLDDSMAIMMAFQTPELEIVGLTTVFGNVSTQDATRNALLLVCTKHHLTPQYNSGPGLRFWGMQASRLFSKY